MAARCIKPQAGRTTPVIVVEQLNRSQWHAVRPDGGSPGVGNWVHAVADALQWAVFDGHAVESVDLDGERRLLLIAERAFLRSGGAA